MPKAATRIRLLGAARELIAAGDGRLPSAGAVARRAGVSRLTVYHHFGSHRGLLAAVSDYPGVASLPLGADLQATIRAACERWATNPALFRRLPPREAPETARDLAAALASADRLRPGCSIREAEDVIGIATSFSAFDRLHHDGRRSPAAVAEILYRLTSTILAA